MDTTDAAGSACEPAALVCFEVGGRTYAIEVAHMREVVHWQSATPLPNAPALIAGVVDLRGMIVPVLDMGRALGGEPTREGPRARILVIEFDQMLVGLAVEAATTVVAAPVSSVEEPPALAAKAGYEAVDSVVRRSEEDPILVLSVEHLLSQLEGPELPGAGGEA